MTKSFREQLEELHACQPAIDWVNNKDLKTAWATCERGDWMLWLADHINIDKKLMVLAACDCAEPALSYIPANEKRPAKAIETASNWCNGKAYIEEVNAAADAAYDAGYAAYAADTAYAPGSAAACAAYAAAHAACASDATAQAAAHASDAAAYAAHAANAANATARGTFADYATCRAAHDENLKESADIVRERIPFEMIEKAVQEIE